MEVEAESVAYIVAGMVGLDTSESSIGYITSWANADTDVLRDTAAAYANWVFIEDHAPGKTPGVDEYETIRELVLRCKRILQEQDRATITDQQFALSEDHDYNTLLYLTQRSGTQIAVSQDGTIVAQLDGEAMAEWLESFIGSTEKWEYSRDLALERARRSGYFTALPELDGTVR